jgi:cytochrome P450
MDLPPDPIAAVTHPDPYPYYADLVASRPLYRDEALGLWVASSAEAVTAVLTSDLCRVRPPAEPVPKALLGSPAAEIFRHLVRMNDGPGHCPFKAAVSAALGSIDPARAAERSREWAGRIVVGIGPKADPGRLANFAFHLPVYVVATLLGVPEDDLPQTALWMSRFVPSLAPGCRPEPLERGKEAAGHLLDLFRGLLAESRTDGLLADLAREARRVGREEESVIAANGIGFLFQAHDATAGLIGNTLIALASNGDASEHVTADAGLLGQAIQETLRYDPPVQNTRRFVARDGVVAGQEMKEGDGILVVLAAANRDPAANPNPDRFDLFRKDRRTVTLGAGLHACPGESLATTIAQAGIERLLLAGLDLERFAENRAYRVSVNGRIPFAASPGLNGSTAPHSPRSF